MNPLPIEQAQSADLRGSYPALRRAAQRAREIARQTGTCLVYGEPDGTVAQITPGELDRIENAWADEAGRRLSTYRVGKATPLSAMELPPKAKP